MGWRNCYASDVLIGEVNVMAPGRSKASDGTIGDAAHASRSSDHNPWVVVGGQGVVRARDITRAGLDLPALFERLRRMGAAGDPRLTGGGYLILDRRITKPDWSGWKAYTGSNPHVKHGHVSFSRNQGGFDSRAPWGLSSGGVAVPPPKVVPATSGPDVLRPSTVYSAEVKAWQLFLGRSYARFGPLKADGYYGDATERFVRQVQEFRGITADGISGPATFRATNYR